MGKIIDTQDECLQRILHLVRDSGSKGADRFQPLGLDELKLGRFQFIVGFLEIGQCAAKYLVVFLPLG